MEFWRRLWSFFRLDFKAAFAKNTHSLPLVTNQDNANQALWPSQIHLNSKELLLLQRRRALLNWHDDFESQINGVALDVVDSFALRTRNQIQQLGLTRKVFAKPAAEALGPAFNNQVRYPISEKVRGAEARLRELTSTWADPSNLKLSLRVIEIDPTLTILRRISLKSGNQEKIMEKLEKLVFAKGGILDSQTAHSLTVVEDLLKKLDELR